MLRIITIIGASCALAACAVPSAARTADVLPAGSFLVGGYLGGTFGSEKRPDATPLEVAWNYGLSARAGLPGPCDVGVDLMIVRLGGNLRCGILNTRRGDPISLAPVVGAAYLPGRGPEWSAGIDLGTTIRDAVKPLVNLSVSRGTHWYFVPSSEPRHLEQSRYDTLTRTETRLSATFGTAVATYAKEDDPSPWLVLGITPYWTFERDVPLGPSPHFGGVMWTFSGYADLGFRPK